MAIEGDSGFGIDNCPYCNSSDLIDLEGEAGGYGKKCLNCREKWAISGLTRGETLTEVGSR